MATTLLTLVETHDYQRLFLENLRWSRPDMPNLNVVLDEERSFTAVNVSSYKGLRVWVCPVLPNSSQQAAIDRAIAKQSVDRIVIFHDEDKQVWRWPSRTAKAGSVNTRLTSHIHVRGMKNPKMLDRLETITLGATEKLSATDVIERVKQAFDVETERETKRASKLMASMYDALSMAGAPEHDISVTLARILFLMFGDDTDMWDADLFQNFIINHTHANGSDLAERINELFAHLNTKPDNAQNAPSHLKEFKYVNGGIFSERIKLGTVGPEMRTTILDACSTNWAGISPAIFGSMFQSVRDDDTRREFGEHYTSEKDILKTLNPLFLDELRSEFERAVGHREEFSRLVKLRERLSRIRFMDPACGCGNFIIIAYREMRLLEISILERLRIKESEQFVSLAPDQLEFGLEGELDTEGRSRTTLLDPVVRLDNFYGIEIDEWPAKIAETAMFLVDRQCDLQMRDRLGYAPERLPISRQATIATATSTDPQHGNALRLDWNELFSADEDTIVAGNPPYAGQYLRTAAQTSDLQHVWGNEYDGYLDFVTGWHIKTMNFLAKTTNARFAFVTTNSVAQGKPVRSLASAWIKRGWRIAFAHRGFKWFSEASGAAGVHVSIVGFDKKASSTGACRLFTYGKGGVGKPHELIVGNISPYLVVGPDVAVLESRRPVSDSLPEVRYGIKPVDGGQLIVTEKEYAEVAHDAVAARYLRKFLGAKELIHNKSRWCLWLTDASVEEIQNSDILRTRVDAVRELRLKSPDKEAREGAARSHELLRARVHPKQDYLAIPRHVAEDRNCFLSLHCGTDTINSDANFTADDPDGFLFSVLSSAMFLAWQKGIGGRIRNDLRFANTLTWNTFPLPNQIDSGKRAACIAAGVSVLEVRETLAPKSLAEMYAPSMISDDLLAAHRELDRSFDDLISDGLQFDSEEGRLEFLIREYSKMVPSAQLKFR